MKPEITYCLLAEIKSKNSNIKSLVDVFEELVESLLANYFKAGAVKGSLDDLRKQFIKTYSIDIPFPTLKVILSRLSDKYGDKVNLYTDYSFSFVKDVFIPNLKSIGEDEKLIEELKCIYCKFAEKYGSSSDDLFKFIEQSKRDLINYMTKPESLEVNNWDDKVVDFIRLMVSIDKYKVIFEKLIMGSLISAYFELKLENAGVRKKLILDTNFIISLMDLHSEESYITTSSIIALAKKASFDLEVLPETIDEVRNLLNKKALQVDRVSIFRSQQKHTVEAGCERRRLKGSDLEVFRDRLEAFLNDKKITIVSPEVNNRLLFKIQETEIYQKLMDRPFNKDGVLHDAVAMRYVKEFRTGLERSFAEIGSFLVTDTTGFMENKINHLTYLPYVIRAEELLNIMWLSNPILDSSILSSNISKLITIHLEKKLPNREMLARIDAKLENYADYALDEKACAELAINIAELDSQQLVSLLDTEEKDQFKTRLLEAVKDAKINAKKSEKNKTEEYNLLLQILEQEKISEAVAMDSKHKSEVEQIKSFYDTYEKIKETEFIQDIICRDAEEIDKIKIDIEDIEEQIDKRFRFVNVTVISVTLVAILVLIVNMVLPKWQKAEPYTYIISVSPFLGLMLFYLFTGRTFNRKRAIATIKKRINNKKYQSLERKKTELIKIEKRVVDNTRRIATHML